MSKYFVSKFDESTHIVIDQKDQREICVCSNYGDTEDARERAERISLLLNTNLEDQ